MEKQKICTVVTHTPTPPPAHIYVISYFDILYIYIFRSAKGAIGPAPEPMQRACDAGRPLQAGIPWMNDAVAGYTMPVDVVVVIFFRLDYYNRPMLHCKYLLYIYIYIYILEHYLLTCKNQQKNTTSTETNNC